MEIRSLDLIFLGTRAARKQIKNKSVEPQNSLY